MSDNTCNMTHRALPPKLKFKVLNEAPMADLLKRPRSEQAVALVEALATATEEYEAQIGLRTRKRTAKAAKSFRDTIGAFFSDLCPAQANPVVMATAIDPVTMEHSRQRLPKVGPFRTSSISGQRWA